PGNTSSSFFSLVWNLTDALCGSPAFNYSVWYNTFAQLDGFALGGLLACLLHSRRYVFPAYARAVILAVAVWIYWSIGSAPYAGYYGWFPIWTYPLAAFGSALCILAFVSAPSRNTLTVLQRVLSYLGKISYGLYVYHVPAIRLAEREIVDGVVPNN